MEYFRIRTSWQNIGTDIVYFRKSAGLDDNSNQKGKHFNALDFDKFQERDLEKWKKNKSRLIFIFLLYKRSLGWKN